MKHALSIKLNLFLSYHYKKLKISQAIILGKYSVEAVGQKSKAIY